MIIPKGGFFYKPSELYTTSVPTTSSSDSLGYPIQDRSVYNTNAWQGAALLVAMYSNPVNHLYQTRVMPQPVASMTTRSRINTSMLQSGIPHLKGSDMCFALRASLRNDVILSAIFVNAQPGTRVHVIRVNPAAGFAPGHASNIIVNERKSKINFFNPALGPPRYDVHNTVFFVVIRGCGYFSCNANQNIEMRQQIDYAPTMSSMPGSYLHTDIPHVAVAW